MSQCGSCSHSMVVLTISTYFFALSPISTRRRMASERETAFETDHASIVASISSGSRM